MPTAEGRIATDRASRYLVQLCRHASMMRRMRRQAPAAHGGRHMPEVQDVDWSDTHGTVRFTEGQWTLDATSDALTLHIEADGEEALRRLQNGITGRLEKIGRRDRLTVTWQDPPTPPAPPSDQAQAPRDEVWRRRRLARTAGLLMVGALVVALHLGAAGAALAASSWTDWAANGVLALVALKVVFMAGHVIVGRAGISRGKALLAHRGPRHASALPAPRTQDTRPGRDRTSRGPRLTPDPPRRLADALPQAQTRYRLSASAEVTRKRLDGVQPPAEPRDRRVWRALRRTPYGR